MTDKPKPEKPEKPEAGKAGANRPANVRQPVPGEIRKQHVIDPETGEKRAIHVRYLKVRRPKSS